MLTSVAPNGAPPTPAREFTVVPIDEKWEPRVGDELRSKLDDSVRTITNIFPGGFTYQNGGSGDFNSYREHYNQSWSTSECFRPVAPVPPTITIKLPIMPPAVPLTAMSVAIDAECAAIAAMLQSKNRAYGNSIADPIKVFSKADTDERINVRLDDKISRLVHGKAEDNEDTELDLIGYLILRRAKRRAQGKS